VLAPLVVGLVVGLLIVLAIRASRRSAHPPGTPPVRDTPLEILARRFAAGEITAEEYQSAIDLLERGGET
jgi:uncharacterized membrane protein